MAASAAKFTKTDHGLSVGDQVTITKNAPTAYAVGTTYHVESVNGNDFTLEATNGGGVLAPTSNVTDMEFTSDTVAGTTNGAGTPSGSVISASHALVTGDKVVLNDAHGGQLTQAAFYIYKTDANSFKIYDTAINARSGAATGLQTFNANGAVRFSLSTSDTSVAIYNKANELKKGMFLTTSPIATGEDDTGQSSAEFDLGLDVCNRIGLL